MAFVNTKRAFLTILVHIKFTCFFVSFTDQKFSFHGSLKDHVVVDECCCIELHYLKKARSVPQKLSNKIDMWFLSLSSLHNVRSSRLSAYCNEHPSWFHTYCGSGCRVLPVPTSPSRFDAFETKMTSHHSRRSISTTLRNNRVVNV